MESILHKIRFLQGDMGPGERKIAAFILENPEALLTLSISELSERCGCGDATAVRFAKRLGFTGYQALKIGVAGELRATSAISREITAEDSCFAIFKKRIHDISVSLEGTESVLDENTLDRAAHVIAEARRVVVFGLGNSAAVAQDAAHKFLRLGLHAQACCDNHMQAIIASHLDRHSVAIGISHSGASRDIVEALRLSKIGGATTICVTNYGISPIVEASDMALFTKSDETTHSILAMSSRIAQLAIFDAIYTFIVARSDRLAQQEIYKTEFALQEKKI